MEIQVFRPTVTGTFLPCDTEIIARIFYSNLVYNVSMSINIHILMASEEIRPYSEQLKLSAESVIASVLYPIKDIDLVFYDNPGAIADENSGIGISSPNPSTILVALNPHQENFEKNIKKNLPPLLVKELQDSKFR